MGFGRAADHDDWVAYVLKHLCFEEDGSVDHHELLFAPNARVNLFEDGPHDLSAHFGSQHLAEVRIPEYKIRKFLAIDFPARRHKILLLFIAKQRQYQIVPGISLLTEFPIDLITIYDMQLVMQAIGHHIH